MAKESGKYLSFGRGITILKEEDALVIVQAGEQPLRELIIGGNAFVRLMAFLTEKEEK